jgi:3-hydroxyacyl-CoA dehydrogenase/enoyl-CoA hydratase/3-hydroxybutyryl-CoA epimerase
MPMGPLELLDQIGLDIAAQVQQSLRPVFTGRIAQNPDFENFAKEGHLGQKTGQGFYSYKGNTKKAIEDDSEKHSDLSPDRARDRMVLLMVNEAAMCLGEGIGADAETIDTAMVFGTGWAPHRGGPLRYADDRGLWVVFTVLNELSKSVGPRFAPCAELRRRAEAVEPFYPSARSEADRRREELGKVLWSGH